MLQDAASCCLSCIGYLLSTEDGFTTSIRGKCYILVFSSMVLITGTMFGIIYAGYATEDVMYVRSQSSADFNFTSAVDACHMLPPASFFLSTNKAQMKLLVAAGCIYQSFFLQTIEEQQRRKAAAEEARKEEGDALAVATGDYVPEGDPIAVAGILVAFVFYLILHMMSQTPRAINTVYRFVGLWEDQNVYKLYLKKGLKASSFFLLMNLPLELYINTLLGPTCRAPAGTSGIWKCDEIAMKQFVVFMPCLGFFFVCYLSFGVRPQQRRSGAVLSKAKRCCAMLPLKSSQVAGQVTSPMTAAQIVNDSTPLDGEEMIRAAELRRQNIKQTSAVVIGLMMCVMAVFAAWDLYVERFPQVSVAVGAALGGDYSFMTSPRPRLPQDDIPWLTRVMKMRAIGGIIQFAVGMVASRAFEEDDSKKSKTGRPSHRRSLSLDDMFLETAAMIPKDNTAIHRVSSHNNLNEEQEV